MKLGTKPVKTALPEELIETLKEPIVTTPSVTGELPFIRYTVNLPEASGDALGEDVDVAVGKNILPPDAGVGEGELEAGEGEEV